MDGAIHDADNNMRFLDIIRHNAERLARLTEDLLTLSRVELRRQDFHPGFYPIEDLIADALEMLRPIAEKKEIRLTQDNSAMGSEAWCDAEAVSQVLSNLLDNAIKYTPVGGTIGAGARLSGREIEVHVRDSGVGIPAEDLPRLFERFYRVDKARSRALGGTGLGLSIVKHLVAAQGGKVWVESSINQGSTFFFTLPAEDPGRTPGQQLNAEFTAL
jgi:two-component system phosphate regulon sensor histidine kinase PhoR